MYQLLLIFCLCVYLAGCTTSTSPTGDISTRLPPALATTEPALAEDLSVASPVSTQVAPFLTDEAQVSQTPTTYVESNPTLESKALTLYEAWDVAHDYAKTWSEEAILLELSSTDVADPNPDQAGQDGRRRSWLAVFTSPNLNKELKFYITDGVVSNPIEDGAYDPAVPIIAEKPVIDSPEALKRVLATNPDFAPGVGKGKGYHFILQTGADSKPVLTVVGSEIINLDAKTGQ
ncbi:MAG: hypothetical protein L6R45_05265 [Anaerolineae bacterium]|nr:hypothetical protein [Anaerolineae bacterium]